MLLEMVRVFENIYWGYHLLEGGGCRGAVMCECVCLSWRKVKVEHPPSIMVGKTHTILIKIEYYLLQHKI